MADDRFHKNMNAAFLGLFAGMKVADNYSQKAFDEGKVVQGAAIMTVCAVAGAFFGIINNDAIYQTAHDEGNRYNISSTTENKKRLAVAGALAGADIANSFLPDIYKKELPEIGYSIVAASAVAGGALGYLNSILTENEALSHANVILNERTNNTIER
ncbi:MAG: hypothetical protein PQ612_07870 [Rickettsiales bacterium]|nr:hypothetical protein [Pseudomonadota bacterium]MDA0967004.1 hypothetical protein [Pseudomonadota bacterium]MDG4543924.1 hypothetical protein [Rickettsiales bacterium]MDG4546070.1 hypothetical protein [Rickettsiales bacterium]MDG4548316.1 hypothetical protein [Rickettsiales bacterium]